MTVLALLFAVPIALLSAIYVSQYAPKRAREILKPAIELLASIPSVVLGFFALVLLATIVQSVFGTTYRLNAFVAALEQWPRDGIPANPGAWLMAAAKHRAIDAVRRDRDHPPVQGRPHTTPGTPHSAAERASGALRETIH